MIRTVKEEVFEMEDATNIVKLKPVGVELRLLRGTFRISSREGRPGHRDGKYSSLQT